MTVTIRTADPGEPGALTLLNASHALMQSLFHPDDNHYLEIDQLRVPQVTFFVAEQNGTALGCAALYDKGTYGEIKSMFVSDAARGMGVGALLLSRLEDHARMLKLPAMRLETGDVLHAAHRLYGRHGFVLCGVFGDYKDTKASVFMEKLL